MRILIFCTLIFSAQFVYAQTNNEPEASTDETMQTFAYHPIVSEADSGEDLWVTIEIPQDWKWDSVQLFYRSMGSVSAYKMAKFGRKADGGYTVKIPGRDLQPPGVEYYIATQSKVGDVERFASIEDPHPVWVSGDTDETRREARLARHRGNTSEFELRGRYTNFGRRRIETPDGEQSSEWTSDAFWVAEAGYTFRPLALLYDFGFGLGVLRGKSRRVRNRFRSSAVFFRMSERLLVSTTGSAQRRWSFIEIFRLDRRFCSARVREGLRSEAVFYYA